MSVAAYTRGVEALLSGAVNLSTVTVKAMLATATYIPDTAAHQFRSQITGVAGAEVAQGAGYTTGGVNTTATVAYNGASNRVDITFGAVSWSAPSGQTLTARSVVYYVSSGNAATDRLLALNDFGSNQSATNQSLNVASLTVRFADTDPLLLDGDVLLMR